MKKGEILTAVDFGSRDIRVLIAQQTEEGSIHILGHGVTPARGCVSQGVIQDISATQAALKKALNAAEKEAGVKSFSVFCGMNGRNVESFIREGYLKLETPEVDKQHMHEALELASRDVLANGKNVISSVTSQEWYVDDLRVKDPVGIRGSVLKTRVHFAQIPTVIEDNIFACVEGLNRELEDVVFLPIASALGCLTPEDYELGAAVIDFGRTNTGLTVYRDRRLLASHIFEFGGFHITRDVAAGLQVSFEEAVDLVLEYGIANRLIFAEGDEDERDIDDARTNHIKLKTVVRGAPSIVDRRELDDIVYERSKELLTKVRQYLHARGLAKNLVRGIVITGGTANIRYLPALAESVFQVPTRIGLPDGIDLMPTPIAAPEFSPCVGILRHGFTYRAAVRSGRIEPMRGPFSTLLRSVGGALSKYFT